MRFGVCTSVGNAPLLRDAGYDFIEENVQNFLKPELPESEWNGPKLSAASPLPIEAANVLMPARLKITGPAADFAALRAHMTTVLARARAVGIKVLVFGSGAARKVEDNFDRETARRQILDFARMAADLAASHDVTIVAEHLRKDETNIMNSVAEAMQYVSAVHHPNFECLVDSYHFWQENEPLDSLAAAMAHIRHVHVADKSTRLAPGQTSPEALALYAPFFRTIKAAGYDRRISIEATWKPELASDARTVLHRLRELWTQA